LSCIKGIRRCPGFVGLGTDFLMHVVADASRWVEASGQRNDLPEAIEEPPCKQSRSFRRNIA